MPTIQTITASELIIKDVSLYFRRHVRRKRIMYLEDGYRLSICTGMHYYASVEVALIKDDHFVKHPTDPNFGDEYDFSIRECTTVESFAIMLRDLLDAMTETPDRPIPLIWADLWG